MWIEIISILAAGVATVLYFLLSYRVLIPYFHQFNYPFNDATKFVLALSFIGSSIVLYFFGTPAMLAFKTIGADKLNEAIYVFVALFIAAMIYSIVLFRFSALVVQVTLRENEKAELAKNNFQVAGFHGVVHIFFALLLSERVVSAILSILQ
jgi:hypothetical protein